jgi:hypothetical protein
MLKGNYRRQNRSRFSAGFARVPAAGALSAEDAQGAPPFCSRTKIRSLEDDPGAEPISRFTPDRILASLYRSSYRRTPRSDGRFPCFLSWSACTPSQELIHQ